MGPIYQLPHIYDYLLSAAATAGGLVLTKAAAIAVSQQTQLINVAI